MKIDCLINSSTPDGSFHISFLLDEKIILYIERNMVENDYKGKVIYNIEMNLGDYVKEFYSSYFCNNEYITYNSIEDKLNSLKQSYMNSINNVTSYIKSNPNAEEGYVNYIKDSIKEVFGLIIPDDSLEDLSQHAAKLFVDKWCSQDTEEVIVNNQRL